MRVWMWPGFQRLADGADAAVHHVAGRDDVDAGLGVRHGLRVSTRHGFVVQDVAVVVQQPSWPWLVKGPAPRRSSRPVRERFFSATTRGNQAVRVPGFPPSGVLSDWSITGNRAITTGMPSLTQSSATGSSRSRLRRSPGHGCHRLRASRCRHHEHRIEGVRG